MTAAFKELLSTFYIMTTIHSLLHIMEGDGKGLSYSRLKKIFNETFTVYYALSINHSCLSKYCYAIDNLFSEISKALLLFLGENKSFSSFHLNRSINSQVNFILSQSTGSRFKMQMYEKWMLCPVEKHIHSEICL